MKLEETKKFLSEEKVEVQGTKLGWWKYKFSIDKGVDEGALLSKFDNGKLVKIKMLGEKDDK